MEIGYVSVSVCNEAKYTVQSVCITLTSSVHHSSYQLTTMFLSYYNVTQKTIRAEK